MRTASALALALAATLVAVPLPSQTPSAPPPAETPPPPPAQAPVPPPAETPAPPAEPAGAPSLDDTFMETINVRVVTVDVYVTDKQGNRVRGLQKEDFEILENGKPIQITNFYAVEGGQPTVETPPAEAPPPAAPAAPPGVPVAPEIPEDQRLHLIVYVDNFNLRPFNRNRVFRDLREFLSQKLRRGDRVMLVTYDRELHVRHQFTSDPAAIASALFPIEKMSAMGISADSERKDLLREIDDAESAGEVSGRVRQHAESVSNDLSFTLGALKDFVGSLAGLPGRKALLYVSDGLPMRPGEDAFHKLHEKFPDQSSLLDIYSHDFSRRFQELAAHANANRVSFYTLEATGLRVSSAADASEQRPGASALVDSVYISNVQSSLLYLAEATGGMAIINANRPGPQLERVAADFNTYYSLGYTPAHQGDGRYYKIDVKVKGRKGITVRHRDGYRDKTTETRMADGTLSSLFYGFEHNPLGIDLQFGKPSRREDGNYLVPMTVRVPIGRLTLVQQGETHAAKARAFISVMDERGGMAPAQEAPIPIQVPAAELEKARNSLYSLELQLLMRQGPQRVAVAVRDDLNDEASFLRRSIEVR
jgi:VWFA-related protein